jgi:taurine dioxygenase
VTFTSSVAGNAVMEVSPISGYTGAEITGVDLTRPIEPDVVAQIRAALLQWKVIFFRDQHISQSQHVAFGQLFGQVTPAHPTLPAVFPDHPEILRLDNQGKSGRPQRSNAGWHTDVTFVPNPPMASILRGVVLPDYGGDTQWTNLVAAYNDLSPTLQTAIERLRASHQNTLVAAGRDATSDVEKAFQSRVIRSVHPVVRVHPETGERALFVNPVFTTHIVDLPPRESRHLLDLLFEQLSDPAYTVRFRWQPGSIAFWDNRATAHLVPRDVPPGVRRQMERITIAGDTPVGPDGFTSYATAGESFQ